MWQEFLVILTAMTPISELRGALPLAINIFHMPWYEAYGLAVLGNMVPVPVILLGLKGIIKLLGKFRFGRKLTGWIVRYAERRSKTVRKLEKMGLAVFVAIPLPFTGAWTGSLIASALGTPFKDAMLAIGLGVLIAGVVVTCLCLMGWFGAFVAAVGLLNLVAWGMWLGWW